MAGRSAGGIGRARQIRSTSSLRNRPAIVALRTSEESSSIPCDRCPERPRTHKPRHTQLPTNPLSIALSSPQPYTVSVRSTAFLTLTSYDDRGKRHVRAGYVLASAVLCAMPLLGDSSGVIALRGEPIPAGVGFCGTRIEVRESGTTFVARHSRMLQERTRSPDCVRCLRDVCVTPDFDMAPRTGFFLRAAKEPAATKRSMPNFRHKAFITPASSSLPTTRWRNLSTI